MVGRAGVFLIAESVSFVGAPCDDAAESDLRQTLLVSESFLLFKKRKKGRFNLEQSDHYPGSLYRVDLDICKCLAFPGMACVTRGCTGRRPRTSGIGQEPGVAGGNLRLFA